MASFASFQNEIQQLQAKNSYSRDANQLASKVAKIGVGHGNAGKTGKEVESVQTIEHFDDGRTILVSYSALPSVPSVIRG